MLRSVRGVIVGALIFGLSSSSLISAACPEASDVGAFIKEFDSQLRYEMVGKWWDTTSYIDVGVPSAYARYVDSNGTRYRYNIMVSGIYPRDGLTKQDRHLIDRLISENILYLKPSPANKGSMAFRCIYHRSGVTSGHQVGRITVSMMRWF